MLYDIYLGLKFSFSYFSILPITFRVDDDLSKKQVISSMLFFFPFVGFVIASLGIFVFGFIENLGWFGAFCCAILYMILYGFLHTEAVIDVVDAIYAKHSGKDAYAVIKEPTIGAMGAIWTFVLVLLKIGALSYLFLCGYIFEFIVIVVMSRTALLLLIWQNNFKSQFVEHLKFGLLPQIILFWVIVLLLGGFSILGYKIFGILLLGFFSAFLIFKTISHKLGFSNGDVLGATLEGVEILGFILVVSLCHI